MRGPLYTNKDWEKKLNRSILLVVNYCTIIFFLILWFLKIKKWKWILYTCNPQNEKKYINSWRRNLDLKVKRFKKRKRKSDTHDVAIFFSWHWVQFDRYRLSMRVVLQKARSKYTISKGYIFIFVLNLLDLVVNLYICLFLWRF